MVDRQNFFYGLWTVDYGLNMSSICIVAGDPSGDGHAAHLVRALARLKPDLQFSGLGGPAMREAGVALLDELTRTAAIGPFDAARHLRHFLQARRTFERHLAAQHPSLVLLVDFGDFNLPFLAPLAKRYGCRVVYYISPQLWAWGRFRMRWVKRDVDRMLVLFKFEEAFYQRHGVPVTWVGHPLVVEHAPEAPSKEAAQQRLGLNPWRVTVGLLPGSRRQEVRRHLPVLCRAAARIARHMPGVQFLIPQAPGIAAEWLAPATRASRFEAVITQRPLAECLPAMEAAVIASGTATLEAALHAVPMVVVYRTSWPTYLAAKLVVRVPHIAMVNVIAGRALVPEFVQHRAQPTRIAEALVGLLRDSSRMEEMKTGLRAVKTALGLPGAVERAAACVLEELEQNETIPTRPGRRPSRTTTPTGSCSRPANP